MKTWTPLFMLLFITVSGHAQKKMERTLRLLNVESVPYIQVSEARDKDGVLFMDTRKKSEYDISHLENAIWVGYEDFDPQQFKDRKIDLATPIVVYCSIGVRSEDIGEKLQALGYTNVSNLYGGIFAWKNSGLPVVDAEGAQTDKVHAYNRFWGRFLTEGEKVYE